MDKTKSKLSLRLIQRILMYKTCIDWIERWKCIYYTLYYIPIVHILIFLKRVNRLLRCLSAQLTVEFNGVRD